MQLPVDLVLRQVVDKGEHLRQAVEVPGELGVWTLIILVELHDQLSEVLYDELEQGLAVLLQACVEQVAAVFALERVLVSPQDVDDEDFINLGWFVHLTLGGSISQELSDRPGLPLGGHDFADCKEGDEVTQLIEGRAHPQDDRLLQLPIFVLFFD